MVPAETNHKLAEGTLNELTYSIPKAFGLQAFVRRVVISLLSDRVRTGMMYAFVSCTPNFLLTSFYDFPMLMRPLSHFDLAINKGCPNSLVISITSWTTCSCPSRCANGISSFPVSLLDYSSRETTSRCQMTAHSRACGRIGAFQTRFNSHVLSCLTCHPLDFHQGSKRNHGINPNQGACFDCLNNSKFI